MMVSNGKSHLEMDDNYGVPPFQETSTCPLAPHLELRVVEQHQPLTRGNPKIDGKVMVNSW